MSEWAAVVLAAGKGTRMKSSIPKVLHKVCGKEMVRHVADAVREAQSGPLVVVVPPDSGEVRQCLGDSLEYVEQADPKGTGHALLQTETLLRHRAAHLLVLYGDTPLIQPSTLMRLMERHLDGGAVATLLTTRQIPASGLGRIVRDSSGRLVDVVEEADASETQRAIAEVNGGFYGFRADWLWPALRELAPSASGEYYLTSLVRVAAREGVVETVGPEEALEVMGVNDRVQLSEAERAMRERILRRWMLAGVTITDPSTTYIDADVSVGRDTTVHPNTTLGGSTQVGERCVLGPGSMVYDSVVGDECKVVAS
ncbi:MAG: NTP transferase domain-containing protein, partial [Chloroflexi bacterium]|nr:NTP transferase domain-containing protein [Chloroflexota bacterium]